MCIGDAKCFEICEKAFENSHILTCILVDSIANERHLKRLAYIIQGWISGMGIDGPTSVPKVANFY